MENQDKVNEQEQSEMLSEEQTKELLNDIEAQTIDPRDAEIEELKKQIEEQKDKYLRLFADFDNFKKRTERERREFADWAAAELIGDVLSVVDDFERALAVAAPPDAQKFREGIELIHRQLMETLKKRGVQPLQVVGVDFDPQLHQAVAYDETPGARDGEVVGELRRGYRLGEKLLRPALVRVAKAS